MLFYRRNGGIMEFMIGCLVTVAFLAVFGPLIGNLIRLTMFLASFLWPLVFMGIYIIVMANMVSTHGRTYESVILGLIYTFVLLSVVVPLAYLQTKDTV